MSRYKQVVEVLRDVDVNPDDLVTLKQVAQMLGITYAGVSNAVNRGRFPTVIIDTETRHPHQGRRLLVESEVVEYIVSRGAPRPARNPAGGPA